MHVGEVMTNLDAKQMNKIMVTVNLLHILVQIFK